MKKCYLCGKTKVLSEFHRNRSKRDGRQTRCKDCAIKKRQEYYDENREQELENRKFYKDRRRQELQSLLVEYLKVHPCVDCGNDDPIVLEFDHVRGKKRGNVADLVSSVYSWETILEEIGKCEVRCANCHRIRHYYEQA